MESRSGNLVSHYQSKKCIESFDVASDAPVDKLYDRWANVQSLNSRCLRRQYQMKSRSGNLVSHFESKKNRIESIDVASDAPADKLYDRWANLWFRN